MTLIDKETTVPRVHLSGTLFIVVALTIALWSFFSWQQYSEHRISLDRIAEVAAEQLETQLAAEMQSALQRVNYSRTRTEKVLKQNLVNKVDLAFQMTEEIYARTSPLHPPEEVKQLIVETLRPLRFFDGRGYFFIDDMEGRFILLPTAPQFEGQLLPDNRDDTGHLIMQGLIEAARKPRGEGFSRYRWFPPDDAENMADKLAYVRHFAPYDWLIGTGDYLYEWETIQQKDAIERLRSVRFGQTGYVAAISREGNTLLFPADPGMEGKHIDALNPVQHETLIAIQKKALEGGGFIRYRWPLPEQPDRLEYKLAKVELYEPWGWILISTVFENDLTLAVAQELVRYEEEASRRLLNLALVMGVALVSALGAAVLFSRWSSQLFKAYHDENQAQRVSLRKQAIELRENEQKLNDILDGVDAYIYIKGPDLRYQYANRKTCALFGLSHEEIIGQDDSIFFDTATTEAIHANDRRVIEQGERVAVEEINAAASVPFKRTFFSVKLPLRREMGEIYALCGISTDITERKAMEEEIRQFAFCDPLTQLPNRRLLIDRLHQLLATNARSAQHGALLFIDLDNFKTLNDTHGHDKGDMLLQQVAARLVTCVRDGDTVARFGGDEFVIMLSGLGSTAAEANDSAKQVVDKVLERLSTPYVLGNLNHVSTASIGVTVFSGKGFSVEDLLKQADIAMYQAKTAGRNNHRFFDS